MNFYVVHQTMLLHSVDRLMALLATIKLDWEKLAKDKHLFSSSISDAKKFVILKPGHHHWWELHGTHNGKNIYLLRLLILYFWPFEESVYPLLEEWRTSAPRTKPYFIIHCYFKFEFWQEVNFYCACFVNSIKCFNCTLNLRCACLVTACLLDLSLESML